MVVMWDICHRLGSFSALEFFHRAQKSRLSKPLVKNPLLKRGKTVQIFPRVEIILNCVTEGIVETTGSKNCLKIIFLQEGKKLSHSNFWVKSNAIVVKSRIKKTSGMTTIKRERERER